MSFSLAPTKSSRSKQSLVASHASRTLVVSSSDAPRLQSLNWDRGEGKGIRLLGIGVSFRDDDQVNEDLQLDLF